MDTPSQPAQQPQCGIGLPVVSFSLWTSSPSKFGPRLGRIRLTRPTTRQETSTIAIGNASEVVLDTPNILVGTSRGVIPHLSRDHCNSAQAIRWINVPFESFLEQSPPIPTMQSGPNPLHSFLGFETRKHIASLCLRDPLDTREMPANGNAHVSANCVRGVRKVTPTDWRSFVLKLQPDIIFALSDTPFTVPPHSQKRVTKSIERSAAWLAHMLQPLENQDLSTLSIADRVSKHPLNVFVNMAGGTSVPAREVFAHSLSEALFGTELEAVKPLKRLDDGVAGYSFDLAALRGVIPRPLAPHRRMQDSLLQGGSPSMLQDAKLLSEVSTPTGSGLESSLSLSLEFPEPSVPPDVVLLFQASLRSLPERKPRVVTGVRSPHDMLRCIRDIGIDVFDAGLAIDAAHVGVALDFAFPLPAEQNAEMLTEKRRDVGHNLYDRVYAHQFTRLSDCLAGGAEAERSFSTLPVCPCIACSPCSPASHIIHSSVDIQSYADGDRRGKVAYQPPHSRAYLHHLLHTHEMSAHTLLVTHNLAVLDIFLSGVRKVLAAENTNGQGDGEGNVGGTTRFAVEVNRFESMYNEGSELIAAAREDWRDVKFARGKGRLAREKQKRAFESTAEHIGG